MWCMMIAHYTIRGDLVFVPRVQYNEKQEWVIWPDSSSYEKALKKEKMI